ncbi:MAG: alpha/beta hydrolase [Myxococcales bacterium]|nr:alpha/beta hydrolase [Myxococcales bacterium]
MTLAVGLADSLALRALRARGFRSRHEASSLGPLHVLEGEGTGPIPILVVLHGLGAAATDMGPLMLAVRSLAVRILVPDLPGHGLNPDVPGSSMEQQEQAVVEVLDRLLEDQPAVVYGNSLGGIVALRYALRRPDRVAGVMVASPGGARTTEEEHRLVMSSFRSDTLRNSAALVARVFPNLWFRQHFVVGMSIRLRRPAARGFLLEARYDQTFLPEELAALRAPILLSWGADERVFPPSHLAFFKRSLPPHAEIQEPEGHGHSAFIKDARGVAAQLRKFSHSPSGDPRR